MLHGFKLLGVTITNETNEKVSEYVIERLKNSHKQFFITTPNPEILVYANSHLDYKDKLNEAEVSLPDGTGILWAAKRLGIGVKERIAGVDFMEKLCKACEEKPLSMGFLGGRGGVAELTAQRLKKKYPWIEIGFVGEEWDDSSFVRGPAAPHPSPTASVASLPAGARHGVPSRVTPFSDNKIDILFVAYGFPKQEEWIVENLDRLPVKAAMGVGGAFDYLSGKVPRAPKFLRALGLEWLFRLLVQPWRIKRQLALLKFIFLVLEQK